MSVLQVYTIDNYYRNLTVVGYATINIFVETGTERQPSVDHAGMQVCLGFSSNVLCFTLRG
jgi:hypothetical protein